MKTIFVQIASYRDAECKQTIHDLFSKATSPDRVYVGLNWQYAEEDSDIPFFDHPYRDRIRIFQFPYTEAKGCCWARSITESLYCGEDYVLNIDAHMRFVAGWDEQLINLHCQLVATGYAKPVISYYPPAYTLPGDQLDDRITKMVPHVLMVNGVNRRIFINSRGASLSPGHPPFLQASVAAGFLFAPGSIIEEVPYDPHLYFFGEEITLAARLWTHGYDLFHPACVLAYHLYKRQKDSSGAIKKSRNLSVHHSEHADSDERTRRSYARVRHILGTEPSSEPEATQELARYGLGKARTIYQFSRFAGLDFQSLKIRAFTRQSIHFKERLPAGADGEIATLALAELAAYEKRPAGDAAALMAAFSVTGARSVLDLGALFGAAFVAIRDKSAIACYLALTVSPSRAHSLQQRLRRQAGSYAGQINYAAEPLPCCELVVVGDLLSRVSVQIAWQLLDSIYASGSRYLCVEQTRENSGLVGTPYFLPAPAFSFAGAGGERQWMIWDMAHRPNLFEALPERESLARRIILESLAECVAILQSAFSDRIDWFRSLIVASCEVPKSEAEIIFGAPEIKAWLLNNGGEEAVRALDLWWCLRRRNFTVAKRTIRHPLFDGTLEVDSWFMQSVAWDYFDNLPLPA